MATPLYADGTKPEEMGPLVASVENDVGPIHVMVYNIGAQVGVRSVEQTSYRIFEMAWRMGSLGAFVGAKEVAPHMLKRGGGTMIFTSATAALRGNQGQHAHTAAMAGRRALCQSLNHELGGGGIHVCCVNLDGPVLSPETLGKLMPELYRKYCDERLPRDQIILPEAVAETYFMLHYIHIYIYIYVGIYIYIYTYNFY